MSFRKRSVTTLLLSTLLLTFGSLGSYAKAQIVSGGSPFVCTNKILKGKYASQASGFANNKILQPSDSGFTPVAVLFLDQFDGNGNVKGKGTISVGGEITENSSGTGTYQVNSDCTVKILFSSPNVPDSPISGIILEQGRKILYIYTYSGSIVTGKFEKI